MVPSGLRKRLFDKELVFGLESPKALVPEPVKAFEDPKRLVEGCSFVLLAPFFEEQN